MKTRDKRRGTPFLNAFFLMLQVLCILILPVFAWQSSAGVITVPGDYSTIQAAIDAAGDGDEIIVSPGTYYENLNIADQNIILRSTDPTNPGVVASTIIDGNQAGSVVTFSGMTYTSAVLSGFTITNGSADYGGGIACTLSNTPTIEYNVISHNSAQSNGGGIYRCGGVTKNNTICFNMAYSVAIDPADWPYGGGGLAKCGGIIRENIISGNWAADSGGGINSFWGENLEHNSITNNTAGGQGGGMHNCLGYIRNNIISYNHADASGGGLDNCSGWIQNNIISGNSAGTVGGGLFAVQNIIENNVIYGNSAEDSGGGLYLCHLSTWIRNCIVWGNTAGGEVQIGASNTPEYSCIQDWSGGGVGNISSNPRFFDAYNGNFSLACDSPCIDAGNPDLLYNDGCRPPGLGSKRNDMGAYGGPLNCDWQTTFGCTRAMNYDFNASSDGWSFSTLTGYPLPTSGMVGGMLALNSAHDTQSRFGFWQTSPGVVSWEPGQVFRARCAVQTDQIDPTSIPTFRLRFTTENFTGSAALSVVSLRSCSYSPPTSGTKEYCLLYYPAAPDQLGLAFDMLDFDPGEWGTISLDSVIIEKFPPSLFSGTLVKTYDNDHDFNAWEWSPNFGNPGWGGCTPGRSGGIISIQSNGQPQAAFWQSPANDLTYVSGKLYRALFTMSRGTGNTAATMPWCRIRCFNEDGQMSQELNINNGFSGIATPPEPPQERNYYVYWQTPDLPESPSTDEDGFRVAIDMLNFGAGEVGTYILDNVIVEYFEIPAYSTP